MNILAETIPHVTFDAEHFHVHLPNDVSFSFPISGNWRFEQATPNQLSNVEIDEDGLHWPEIDEYLSFAGLLRGDYGQYVRKCPV